MIDYINNLLKPYKGLQREIYILAISRFVNALGALIFPFLTLILSEKIGLDEGATGIYIAVLGIMFIPSGLIGGKIADHFGRKNTILLFEFLGMICYMISVFIEPSMLMVYVLMMAAILFGFAGPAHDALVADYSKDKDREGAYSLLYLGFNLGFAFAMILGGRLFADHLSLMFVIDVITALIALTLIALYVKDKAVDPSVTVEKEIDTERASQNEEVSSLEKAQIGTIFQVLKERPVLIEFGLLMFLYRFVYAQWGFLMPLHIVGIFGEKAGGVVYGNAGTLNAIIVVVFTAVITKVFSKQSSIMRIVIAGLFFAVGFGMLGFVETKWAFYISVFIFTIGEIIEAISTMPFIMNHTPESHRARMSSVMMTVMSIGYSLSPLLFGWILKITTYNVAWLITGLIALLGTLGMWHLYYREVGTGLVVRKTS